MLALYHSAENSKISKADIKLISCNASLHNCNRTKVEPSLLMLCNTSNQYNEVE